MPAKTQLLRSLMPNLVALVLGLLLATLSINFRWKSFPDQTLGGILATFVLVTGVQLMLWALGIRLELFGTVTDSEKPLFMADKAVDANSPQGWPENAGPTVVFRSRNTLKATQLPVPNWTQVIEATVGILGIPLLLILNRDFRSWFSALKFAPRPHLLPSQDRHLIILYIGQVVAIGTFMFVQHHQLGYLTKKLRHAGPIAQNTLRQFRASWMFMWSMWLGLYIWLSARAFGPPSDWLDSVTDVFNTVSGFAIWCCFIILDKPSVKIASEPDRDKPYRTAVWVAAAAGLLCACLGPADRLLQLGHIGLVSIGLYGGLALACLAGRLGSQYIGMPRWMLLFLYLYAMFQLFYSFFDILNPLWTWGVYGSVLVFKIMVGFAGLNMLRYGGLNKYLEAADAEFEVIRRAA